MSTKKETVGKGSDQTAGSSGASLVIPLAERAKLEYEHAHARWTNGTNQRRTGMAFFTAVQGSILSLVGDNLLALDIRSRALVGLAAMVTVIAWNHERRIGAYMEGYRKRALEIETASGMLLLRRGSEEAKRRWTLSNRLLFAWYFIIIFAGWIVVLAHDLVSCLR